MSVVARLEEQAIRPDQGFATLNERASGEGAIGGFTGIARPDSRVGHAVYGLALKHHPAPTLQSLEDGAAEAAAPFDVSDVHVVHRCGGIPSGASLHRSTAFEAAEHLLDRLKIEALFWRWEIGEAGPEWIERTKADYSDRKRWG